MCRWLQFDTSMGNMNQLKAQLINLAAQELGEFLLIISDIGEEGFQIYKYNLLGHTLQQCANKFSTTKRRVQLLVEKCNAKGYADALKKLNML